MFKTRLLSGVILVLLAFILIIPGGEILVVSMGIISLIGMYELYRVVQIEKKAPAIMAYILAIIYYLNLYFNIFDSEMIFAIICIVFLMAVYVFTYPKYSTEQMAVTFFGIFYVAVMLSYVYLTRCMNDGLYLVWLIFLCSWGADTSAYCVGVLIGKHKMSPKLSPKKSIEGAVGGIVGTMIFTYIFFMAFGGKMDMLEGNDTIKFVIISGVCAFVSMIGDLTASAIKRNYDIKDYGTLIPGHGGILDRFDSVIFIAPIVYYLIYYSVGR
ncbi:MAG: phosphatidate cytidylyltransferase [Lachnospiraceae bacterium]|nr:phosphatidate cytidylyltransferase [Lachnospiraceae bacterium]